MKREFNVFSKVKQGISDFLYDTSVDLHEIFHGKEKKHVVKRINPKKTKIVQTLCIWSFLIIPIINFIIFGIYGSISSWPIAFEHYTPDGLVYDFYNFEYVFEAIGKGGSLFKESLTNTFIYWSFAYFVIMPLGYLMAFFLYKRIKGYIFFRYVFFLPAMMSSVIECAFFKYLVGPDGQVQLLIEKLFGLKDVLLLADSQYAFGTLLFYNFYMGLNGNLLMWLASFSRIPQEVVEAGQLDGLTTFKEFWYISIPCTLPMITSLFMLSLLGIFSGSGAALLLTGGAYGTYDIAFFEYTLTTSGAQQDQGIAGAVGLIKMLLTVPLALVINYFTQRTEAVEF